MPWILVHNTWQTNLLWQMDPPHQSRIDALNTGTQYLVDEFAYADGPPGNRAEMPWILVHNTWQTNLLWQMNPQGIEQRCLEYQDTILGRQTCFGRWTPPSIENRCLEYQYTILGRQTCFGRWTPPSIENRCLEYYHTILGRQTYFGRWTPPSVENRCLEYWYTILGRQTYFGRWTPPINQE